MKNKFSIAILVSFFLSTMAVPIAHAQEAVDPAFNPNLLITDAAFGDTGTFGSASAIQTWLSDHGSVLANTSPDFVAKFKEPGTQTKTGLEDPEPNLPQSRTAAELIYDATVKTGLNPQVILVTLQKEQSLILGTFSSSASLQQALDRALGFGCPDSSPCGSIFLGFYFQLFGNFDANGDRYLGAAASLMKSFNYTQNGIRTGRGPEVDANGNTSGGPAVRTSVLGDTISLPNTLGGFSGVAPSQTVTIADFATAALYRYTPHVFNGNYNFWKYYTLWFKYPNGTVIRRIGDTGLYVINNGTKQFFSAFVASQRKINLNQVVDVSETEFDSYTTGAPLVPLDGTLIKGDSDATVYLMQSGAKQPISGPIFAQRKFSFAKVVTLPQSEAASYPTGAFLAPLDGTLITGATDQTVYLIENGQKRPITYNVFVARNLSFKNLLKLSDGEVSGIATGAFLPPPDSTQIQLQGDTGIYWYKDGQKRFVSAFVFKQRSVGNFPLVILGLDEFATIPTVSPLPPKDGTFIKGDASDGIYEMVDGQKDLLTPASYKRLRTPAPVVLPEAEVDSYVSGEVIAK
ncbi:MAG TPA: hypothetical protein VFX17_03860 [Patescibacteria group bacterium]|nr:hypothetical protein [Patescibacteria group bacterium]